MRRMRLRFLLLGAAIVLGLSSIWLAIPRGSEAALPELLQGLPQDWAQADLAFGARVLNRFPDGMSEQDLVAALMDQGFKISPNDRRASFEQPNWVCRLVWQITWSTDEAGLVRGISGQYGGSCL